MKKALFIACLLCPGLAFGQMTIVNSGNAYGCSSGTSSGGTLSVQANGSNFNTTGADLIVFIYNGLLASPTLADSGVNSYTGLTARTDATSTSTQKVFWTKPTTTGANFSWTITGASSFPAMCAIALQGSFTGGSPVLSDNGNVFTSATSPFTLAAGVSTSQSAAFIVTGAGHNTLTPGTITPPVGYQPPVIQPAGSGTNVGLDIAWRFGSGIVTENPSWTFGNPPTGTMSVTIFQSANSTASPLTTQILSMGVGK